MFIKRNEDCELRQGREYMDVCKNKVSRSQIQTGNTNSKQVLKINYLESVLIDDGKCEAEI